ncbi:methyltransferase domain-containing protein [Candidatus Woesearchaeota archaeon]|nr:methyltransferase domain-containing protein [Candidatus Woesearchaeota archaeon]
MMNKQERDKLIEKYEHWRTYDPNPAEKVGWMDKQDQIGRFLQFLKLESFTGKSFVGSSVLDVGCGYGAFLEFLIEQLRSNSFYYFGIDINDKYVERAKETWGGDVGTVLSSPPLFVHAEFADYEFHRSFDFVVASGIFNVNAFDSKDRAYQVIFETVKKMIALATHGVGFNFLSAVLDQGQILTADMVCYDKHKVLDWCKKQECVKKAVIVEGYDPLDSTILLDTRKM